jgi:hypothetical protein
MLPLLLIAPSQASAPLAWTWGPDQHRRYLVETTVLVPGLWELDVRVDSSTFVRTNKVKLRMVMDCSPIDELPQGWELRCDLEDVTLTAGRIEGDPAEDLALALEVLDQRLTGAWMQIVYDRDGRVRSLDLEGTSKADQRARQGHEWSRQLLRRAMSGMDLQLPQEDPSLPWAESNSLLLASPIDAPAPSISRTQHRASRNEAGWIIRSTGTGTVTLGSAESAYMANTWSEAIWDDEGLAERRWAAVAEPSATAADRTRMPYLQGGYLRRLEPGEVVDIGNTGQWLWEYQVGPGDLAMSEVPEGYEGYRPSTFRSPPYATVGLGVAHHHVFGQQNRQSLHATVGVRLPLAIALGGGFSLDQEGSWRDRPVNEWAAWGGAWFETTLRVTPRVGLIGGAAMRGFPGAEPDRAVVPFIAGELGGSVHLSERFWLDAMLRTPYDLQQVVIYEGETHGTNLDRTSIWLGVGLRYKALG